MIVPSSTTPRSYFEYDARSLEWNAMPVGAGGSGSAIDEVRIQLFAEVQMLRELICELLRENEELRSSFGARTHWSKSPAIRGVSILPLAILGNENPRREYSPLLSNLRQYICELLIKNQHLRVALIDSHLGAAEDGRGSFA